MLARQNNFVIIGICNCLIACSMSTSNRHEECMLSAADLLPSISILAMPSTIQTQTRKIESCWKNMFSAIVFHTNSYVNGKQFDYRSPQSTPATYLLEDPTKHNMRLHWFDALHDALLSARSNLDSPLCDQYLSSSLSLQAIIIHIMHIIFQRAAAAAVL